MPDAVVVASAEEVVTAIHESPETPVLVEVQNPFGEAIDAGIDLNGEFDRGPTYGEQAFASLFEKTEAKIAEALGAGADGIFYRLFGAEPNLSTPMQFGGLYLEQERDLLKGIMDARFNVLYVEGGEGTYLDVVSDLPAHAFSWDEDRTAIPAGEVRKFREGALACGLLSEDPLRLFRSVGSAGLILCGKVADLAQTDFSDVISASSALAGAVQ